MAFFKTYLTAITFFAFLPLSPVPAFAEPLLSCSFEAATGFEGLGDRIAVEQGKDKFNMKILVTGADGANPAVTGDFGAGEVFVLRRKPGVIWFAEYPKSGGVSILTVYVDKKIAIYSRQSERDAPYGYMAMGRCK
jgi:hypothetical protein